MHERYTRQLLCFGHRGASGMAPENTLAAFTLAADLGADGVELDVQLTSDGDLAVCHNFSVDDTTNASGGVRSFSAAELSQLDAGSWFDARFAGEHVPTLQEVIDRLGDRLLFNIELKTVSLYRDGLEEALADCIARNRLHERVIVSSFNPFSLRRLQRIDRQIEMGLLYSSDLPRYLRQAWMRHVLRLGALHPEFAMIDAAYVRWAKEKGYRVNTWTVNEPAHISRLIALRVDGIISNYPDRVLHELKQAGLRA